MNPVNVVTIKKLIPIFKDEEKAEKIELVLLEETGFEVVSQKGLYKVGDKAIYIQPDYCLPDDVELFESFTAPGGDPNKSRLGKGNRIKALKFNFHRGDNQTIYSMGILIPKEEVDMFLVNEHNITEDNLSELLQVVKYEEPEIGKSGEQKGDMPVGMYKTDENNFENIKNKIKYPINLIGTLKVDGSSITCYVNHNGEIGICSRSFEKKLDQEKVIGYKNKIGENIRKHFDRESMVRGWLNEDTKDFYADPLPDWKEIKVSTEDSWVKLGTPNLTKIQGYYEQFGFPLVLRGEIVGQGLKGSGNKNNPHTKDKQKMMVYGVDEYNSGVTKKTPFNKAIAYCKDLDIEMVPVIFKKTFKTEKALRKACNDYFKDNMVEGIVLNEVDTTFSCKFMNLEYDSKK